MGDERDYPWELLAGVKLDHVTWALGFDAFLMSKYAPSRPKPPRPFYGMWASYR